ncbi:MAG: hypothetical protein OXR64_07255 [Chloroflexota bacterium]|nr:hypothetical protein [Chloroflexota bacterium]MDE2919629.1 hypothetical protein [Chloroflexota bacterium]
MNHDQPKLETEARRLDVVLDENVAGLRQAEKVDAPDFIQHLLSIPKAGPDDALDRSPLNLRDFAW